MNNKFTAEELAILSALAYFDIFNFPLTFLEVWKLCYFSKNARMKIFPDKVWQILHSESIQKKVKSTGGFFYLSGKEKNIEQRVKNYNIAERKFKKALSWSRIFKFCPGVKGVAVCNNLAWSNAKNDSDIDLFIITCEKMIWSARFFATLLIKIFNQRPGKNRIRDTICLSFFVSENNLNLQTVTLPQLRKNDFGDIYLTYWIAGVVPLYEENGVWKKFAKNNTWIKNSLPNIFTYVTNPRRKIKKAGWWKGVINLLLGNEFLERVYKKIQLFIMPDRLKKLSFSANTQVVINDQMLKFHNDDRRQEFFDLFKFNFDKLISDD